MKYLAIASLAAVAIASPGLQARDGWESWSEPKHVDPTTTWEEWKTKDVHPPKPEETWATWDGKDPKDKDHDKEHDKHHDDKDHDKHDDKHDDDEWADWEPVYTTTVVTAITTYCAEPTKITHAGKVWTVTDKTTLTITDCPCTISVPVYIKTSTSCYDDKKPDATTWAEYPAKTPVKGASTWVDVPVKDASTWADYPAKTPVKDASTWANYPAKTPVADASTWANVAAASTSSGWSPVATWKGAADKVNVGAGLAGVVGIAALLL